MRACGVNLLTVMRWPLAFALLCTFVCLFVNNEVVPRGHEVRRNLTRRLSVGAGLELLEPGRTINDFPKVQLYFHSRDAESGALQDLEIVDRRDPKCTRNFKAKQAFVRQDGRDIVLDVRDLTVDPVDPKHPNTMKAETFRWRVDDVLKDGTYKRKEKDFRFFEMLREIDARKRAVAEAADTPQEAADAEVEAKADSDEDAAEQKAGRKHKSKSREKKYSPRKAARRALSDIRTEFQKRWVFGRAARHPRPAEGVLGGHGHRAPHGARVLPRRDPDDEPGEELPRAPRSAHLAAGGTLRPARRLADTQEPLIQGIKEIMDKPAIDVAYVAELARLDLTDEEKAVFQPQLENIVKYVEKISSVDVDGVPPVNALREDEVRPSMDREEALANAPGRTGDEFLLPKIVEGAES